LVILVLLLGTVVFRTAWPGARRALLFLTVLGVVLTSSAIGQETRSRPSYDDVVQQYRRGHYDDALSELRRFPDGRLSDEADAIARRAMAQPPRLELIESAIALHTDAYLREGKNLMPRGLSTQLAVARRLIDRLRRARAPGPFEKCWYLLVAAQLQALNEFQASEEHLSEARRLFPNDADLLIAAGSGREVRTRFKRRPRANPPVFGVRQLETGSRDMRDDLESAVKSFREAVAIAPEQFEARLRLGRVLYLLGDLDGAARELELARKTQDQVLLYLANLFAARVEEDRGHRVVAADFYVAALKIHAVGQAPYVGLSELLYADAQPEPSKQIIQQLFDQPLAPDPWVIYLSGASWHVPALLNQIRSRVRE
jgi:tetratricopeptide (TPR) repeat protein